MKNHNKILANCYEFILYLDCEEHLTTLDLLTNDDEIRYIGICHDKDIYTDEDLSNAILDNREVSWSVGDLKKKHYHFLVYFNKNITIEQICSMFPLKPNDVGFCYSEKDALIYLLHRKNKDKYQYSITDVLYNNKPLFDKLCKYINQIELKDENMGASRILEFINSYQFYLSYQTLTKFVLLHDLWSVYRRGFAVFSKCIQEHNLRFNEKCLDDD